ncbi:tRNA (guanosine(37)-N1)-methyltransferase TrmD [Candidatus Wolfebacteria bacterium]|nr:MAG: tRNA (guanosine(37)-N1)-methyltransferase TrmD [Candidatus Wolfebacteria bacterium]
MKNFHIVTIFPEVFETYINTSMMWRAQKEKKVKFNFYNPRDFTKNKHNKVDDKPYGGGPGMVMTAQPILDAVKKALLKVKSQKSQVKIFIFSPSGKKFTNATARGLANKYDHIVLICGRYEGVDARVKKILKAEELSIGDYVLTGGEIPAMVVLDAVSRQIEGVLGNDESLEEKRAASSELYTRPEIIIFNKKSYRVPKVLLGGHHAKIEAWRTKKQKGK